MRQKINQGLPRLIVLSILFGILAGRNPGARAAEPIRAAENSPAGQLTAYALQRRLQHAMTKAGWWRQIVRQPNGRLHHAYLIPGSMYYELFDWANLD